MHQGLLPSSTSDDQALARPPAKNRGFRRIDHDFPNIEGHFTDFVNANHFYAELWRHIKPVPTADLGSIAAAVTFVQSEGCYHIGWNPQRFKKMTNQQIQGLLQHEVLHIVWNHVAQKRTPHKIWNAAQDLAINSIIMHDKRDSTKIDLIGSAMIPGVLGMAYDPTTESYIQITDDEEGRKKYPLAHLVATFEPGHTSTEYYAALHASGLFKDDSSLTDGDNDYILGGCDDHSPWKDIDIDDIVNNETRRILAKAVRAADTNGGWGNISAQMRSALRAYVNRTVNWEEHLQYFAGTIRSTHRESTLKRVNRRYAYIHPGVRRTTSARLLVAVDESASVNDGFLERMYAALRNLNESVEIDIIPFDCSIDIDNVKTWEQGSSPEASRTLTGGTSFDAPTDLVNDPEYAGMWDGLLIATDGQAPRPGPCNIPRAWLLPTECKLDFTTDELVMIVNDTINNMM